jgi:carbonic anhydrase
MAFDPSTLNKSYTKLPIPSDFITSQNSSSSSSNTSTDPQILWIGCSDSLILETECLAGLREEMFVYRNLGGLVVNGDLSTQSAIEWGVGLLKVKHVIVCGHYGCAVVCGKGSKSAGGEQEGKSTGEWGRPIANFRSLSQSEGYKHEEESERERERHFEEQYILAEVEWLKQQEIVKEAVESRGMRVHAFVYDRETNVCERLVDDEGKEVEGRA